MNPSVIVVHDTKRGCGYRKLHSLYLRDDGPAIGCGRLPFRLDRCPCCGNGVAYSRRATWLNGDAFIKAYAPVCKNENCFICPLKTDDEGSTHLGMVLLQWIGRKFYTVDEFNAEAQQLGISRRISSVPRGFKIGKSYVFLAHLDAIDNEDGTKTPGVFRVFKPNRIEIIVDGTEPDEEIEAYVNRGLTPVFIERIQE